SIISFLRALRNFYFFIIIIYLSHNETVRQSTNMLCEIIANVKRYFQFTKNYSYEYTTFFELEKLKKKIPSLLNNHGIFIFTLNDYTNTSMKTSTLIHHSCHHLIHHCSTV